MAEDGDEDREGTGTEMGARTWTGTGRGPCFGTCFSYSGVLLILFNSFLILLYHFVFDLYAWDFAVSKDVSSGSVAWRRHY